MARLVGFMVSSAHPNAVLNCFADLRHEPEKIGLRLDAAGWTSVDDLLARCASHGISLSRERLDEIVARSDKQRFAFDEKGNAARASAHHARL